jgi:hypothetical protein
MADLDLMRGKFTSVVLCCALEIRAPRLASRRVPVRCDNTQAVAAINHASTRVRDDRQISRRLVELAIHYELEVRVRGAYRRRSKCARGPPQPAVGAGAESQPCD